MILKLDRQLAMKMLIGAVLAVVSGLCVRVEAQKAMNYGGYRIAVTVPKTKNHSVVTIKKGKKTLVQHSEGIAQDYGSRVELISLTGSARKQLVVSQYTGGTHCCTLYWIYELAPRFRLLFRSKEVETIGYNEVHKLFQNIDADPELEIIDNSPAFYYFDDLAFVSSPAPKLIFDFDRRTQKYELANRRFSRYLLKDQTRSIKNSRAGMDSKTSQYLVDTFGIFLNFVYAGKEPAGWKYYEEEKASSTLGQYFHKEATIRRTLNADPAYRSIYRK